MHSYILNTGIITAIGENTAAHIDSLMHMRHGITQPSILATNHTFPVGEIKKTNEALAQLGNVSNNLPRTALLSIIAAKEAWAPFKDKAQGLRIGLISSNTVGGMDITEQHYSTLISGNTAVSNKLTHHECGNITNLTAQALGLKCFTATISTACSSSANTIMLASKMLKANQLDVCIVGGADALSKFTLNGFNALMILDKELCQPFDEYRRGLNLGEGAAYLVLGNEKAKQQFKSNPITRISGYANANDAHHQTASSPEGIGNQLAMTLALQQAQLPATAIDYINLHGTGTLNNDNSEGAAVSQVFNTVPMASTTKCYTGHTLGAAGAVEAVFSHLAIEYQIAWGSTRVDTPIKALDWSVITKNISQKIQHVLSNSFGFGGNCSSIIISKL